MKQALFSIITFIACTICLLTSCQNLEEPLSVPNENELDFTEYSVSIVVPDKMDTRNSKSDLSTGEFGVDGLLEFPNREVNKLWYAIYYDKNLVQNNTVSRENTQEPFSFTFRLKGYVDPSKIELFFWAGQNSDPVAVTTSESNKSIYGSSIYLNFINKWVCVQASVLNKNCSIGNSFTLFTPFITEAESKETSRSFLLKRAFSEIHVLSDDFIVTDLKKEDKWKDGIHVFPGFGTEKFNKNVLSIQNNLTQPYLWYFDDSEEYFKDQIFAQKCLYQEPYFFNSLSGNLKERTTYKNREMDYWCCLYVFSPVPISNFNYLNLMVMNENNVASSPAQSKAEYISLEIPNQLILPNHKYVFYNKSRENGGSGFIDGVYIHDFDVTVTENADWDNSKTDQAYERI